MLGFRGGASQRIQDANIARVRALKLDFGFVYWASTSFTPHCTPCSSAIKKVYLDGTRKGLYQAKIIQSSVNHIWFRNKKDEGVKYPEFYKPIPESGLALILTAVSLCTLSCFRTLIF